MNPISVVMACFSMLGAIDKLFGNKFGLGKEFDRGLMMLGTLSLSMIGMIVISPLIAELIQPALNAAAAVIPFDPSIVTGSLFANDMGGAPLSVQLANDPKVGLFNGLVVSSMMGCTISFTIPVALGVVKQEQHKEVLLGLLCGIVTIPVGCFVAGLVCGLPLGALILNLLPLVIFSAIIAFGLIKFPNACVRIFKVFGKCIDVLIVVGLAVGIFRFLTGVALLPHLDTFENGAFIIFNAAAVMTGAFPLIFLLSKVLARPLKALGRLLNINDAAATGLLSTLATSVTTFDMVQDMGKKGTVINSAFAISAAFTFAGHLAFTLAFDPAYLPAVMVGKLTAGVLSIFVALFVYRNIYEKKEAVTEA